MKSRLLPWRVERRDDVRTLDQRTRCFRSELTIFFCDFTTELAARLSEAELIGLEAMSREVHERTQRMFHLQGDPRNSGEQRRGYEDADEKRAHNDHAQQPEYRADSLDPGPSLARWIEKDRVVRHEASVETGLPGAAFWSAATSWGISP